jgi:hypothetical protein
MATNFHHIRVRKGMLCFTVIVEGETREEALDTAEDVLFPVSEGFWVYYSEPARLDEDGIAKPLTELVRRIASEDIGKCVDRSYANTYRSTKA